MFYNGQLAFLQTALTKCHLQNRLITPEKEAYESLDEGLKTLLALFPDIQLQTIYRVTDALRCQYLFFLLPSEGDEKKIFAIGPYLTTEFSRQQILEIGEKSGISPKLSKSLESYYATLPVIKEEYHIFALVDTFAEFLWGSNTHYENVDINGENPGTFLMHNFAPTATMEDRYSYENKLIKAVSQGNIHKAELMMANFSPLAFEKRTPDQLRNMKNYCIIMNTLFRKAAEDGGVHPVYLDSVSSDFARKIETIHSVISMPAFMLEILRTYCILVRKHAIKNYSPLVQKAIIEIESDLAGHLNLSELAKKNNVSPGYFSTLFKKETGETLTEYVNNKRMKYAKYLLKHTNLQIQTIAQHCGILDFHYFCRIFKNATGKTPTEYRSNLTEPPRTLPGTL